MIEKPWIETQVHSISSDSIANRDESRTNAIVLILVFMDYLRIGQICDTLILDITSGDSVLAIQYSCRRRVTFPPENIQFPIME